MKLYKFLLICFLFILCFSCSSKGKLTDYGLDDGAVDSYVFPTDSGSVFVVDSIIDLKGRCYRMPADVTLEFKCGTIMNGALIGNKTKIYGSEKLFDRVSIKGTWNVDRISTKMLCNPTDTNALKSLFALASADVSNVIYIQNGYYTVKASTKHPYILNIPSNTMVIIDGTISMVGNDFKSYSILNISKAVNVSVKGNGSLVGERDSHSGESGEWGMCISTYNSDSISISDLNISKGWGDGIYVGKGTKKINISNCKIDNCRRQGISIIEGTEVLIKNCIIEKGMVYVL